LKNKKEGNKMWCIHF